MTHVVTHRDRTILTRDKDLIAVPKSSDIPSPKAFRNPNVINPAYKRV